MKPSSVLLIISMIAGLIAIILWVLRAIDGYNSINIFYPVLFNGLQLLFLFLQIKYNKLKL